MKNVFKIGAAVSAVFGALFVFAQVPDTDVGNPIPPVISADGFAVGQFECSDLIDNDGDGDTDYPTDTGCTSYGDNTEQAAPTGNQITIDIAEVGTCVYARTLGTTTTLDSSCYTSGDPTHTLSIATALAVDLRVERVSSGPICTYYNFDLLATDLTWSTDCIIEETVGGKPVASSVLPPLLDVTTLKGSFIDTQIGWYDIVSTTDKSQGDLNWFMYNRTKVTHIMAMQRDSATMFTEAIETAQWYIPEFNMASSYPGGWDYVEAGADVSQGDAKFTHLFPVRLLWESGTRTKAQIVSDIGYGGTWDQMLDVWRDYNAVDCGWSGQTRQNFGNGPWNGRFAGFCLENAVILCHLADDMTALACTDMETMVDNLYDHHQTIAWPTDTYTGAWLHSWSGNEGDASGIDDPDDCRGFSPWMEGGILIPALYEAWLLTRDPEIEVMIAEFGWALEQYGYLGEGAGATWDRAENNSGEIAWYFACPFDSTKTLEIMNNDGFGADLHIPELEFATAAALYFESRKTLPDQTRIAAFRDRLRGINGSGTEADSFYTASMAALSSPKRIVGWQKHGSAGTEWLTEEGGGLAAAGDNILFEEITVNAGAPTTGANGWHAVHIAEGVVAMNDHSTSGTDPYWTYSAGTLSYGGQLPSPSGIEESSGIGAITISANGADTEVMIVHGQEGGASGDQDDEATIFFNGQRYQDLCTQKMQGVGDFDNDGYGEVLCQEGTVKDISISADVMTITQIGSGVGLLDSDLYSKAVCAIGGKILTDQGLYTLATPAVNVTSGTGFPVQTTAATETTVNDDPTFIKGGMACGDFDNDGDTDLWFSRGGADFAFDGTIELYENTGNDTSPVWATRPGTGLPTVGGVDRRYTLSHAVDLNADGCDDLILSSQGGVWESNCDMTFVNRFSWPYTWPVRKPQTAVGDIDGDTKPDICTTPAAGAQSSSLVRCWRNITGS